MSRRQLLLLALSFVAVAAAAELVAEMRWGHTPPWYPPVFVDGDGAPTAPERSEAAYIIVGSSRLCAVDATLLARLATERDGRRRLVANQCRGYSTLTQHVFGLRDFAAWYPDGVRGVTLIGEMRDGVPLSYGPAGEVVADVTPSWAIPLLTPERIWTSPHSVEKKLELTVRWLTASASASHNRERFLAAARARGGAATDGLARRLLGAPREADLDLPATGGIRADAAGARRAKKQATAAAERMRARLAPPPDWRRSAVVELARFATEHDAALALFEMPVPAPFAAAARESRAARERFAEVAAEHEIQLLEVPLATHEDDFPDGWHLRSSRSRELTRALFDALSARAAARAR